MERLMSLASQRLGLEQLRIVEELSFESGLSAIVAGAGAGKTRVLSFLVAKASLDPSVRSIHLLTATRASKIEAFDRCTALRLELKLDQISEATPLDIFNVRTIHSIAFSHAKRFNASIGGSGVEIVGKTALGERLDGILATLLVNDDETQQEEEAEEPRQKDVVAQMPRAHAVELLLAVRMERLRLNRDVVNADLGPTAEAALERLCRDLMQDEHGKTLSDFDGIIADLASSGEPIVYEDAVLFVDEAQDLSLCQVQILMHALRAGARVVVLGDDSQGIFLFAGAHANTLKTLLALAAEEQPPIPTTRFTLFKNYRSTDAIVDAAERLLPKVDVKDRVGIRGNGTAGDSVEVLYNPKGKFGPVPVCKKIIELLQAGKRPQDIVLLRHKKFSWNDPLVKRLAAMCASAGVQCPISILGCDPTASLAMKAMSVLQIVLGLERFVDSPEEGLGMLRTFLRGIRGSRGASETLMSAIDTVWSAHGCDPADVFTNHKEEVLARLLEIETENDAVFAADGQPNAKRARLADAGSATSRRYKNAAETLRLADRAIVELRARLQQAIEGQPLTPISLSAQQTLAPPPAPFVPPQVTTRLGAVAWVVLRDLAGKLDAADKHDVDEVIGIFDAHETSPDSGLVDGLTDCVLKITTKLLDRETADKLVFSTIHKFKGRERPVAFVCELKEPWAKTTHAQRAVLGDTHHEDCRNLSGENENCDCDGFEDAIRELESNMRAEKRRLHYVAASRARERLFLEFDSEHPLVPEDIRRSANHGDGGWVAI
jgi:superfamily I DNA/RNA helicase